MIILQSLVWCSQLVTILALGSGLRYDPSSAVVLRRSLYYISGSCLSVCIVQCPSIHYTNNLLRQQVVWAAVWLNSWVWPKTWDHLKVNVLICFLNLNIDFIFLTFLWNFEVLSVVTVSHQLYWYINIMQVMINHISPKFKVQTQSINSSIDTFITNQLPATWVHAWQGIQFSQVATVKCDSWLCYNYPTSQYPHFDKVQWLALDAQQSTLLLVHTILHGWLFGHGGLLAPELGLTLLAPWPLDGGSGQTTCYLLINMDRSWQ